MGSQGVVCENLRTQWYSPVDAQLVDRLVSRHLGSSASARIQEAHQRKRCGEDHLWSDGPFHGVLWYSKGLFPCVRKRNLHLENEARSGMPAAVDAPSRASSRKLTEWHLWAGEKLAANEKKDCQTTIAVTLAASSYRCINFLTRPRGSILARIFLSRGTGRADFGPQL